MVRPDLRAPFTADELERVGDQFDEVMRGLVTYARRRLTVEEVVRALRWTHNSSSVADIVNVPNEYVGRFSHVEERAVHERTSQIVRERPSLAL